MEKKGFLRVAAVMLLFVGLTAGAYAQVTVSGGFALSNMEAKVSGGGYSVDGDVGFGGNVYADYLLPISIPLSLGLEIGVDGSSFAEDDYNYEDKVTAIPILVRAAYHFDLNPKLDLYLVGKIGYVFGTWEGDLKDDAEDAGTVDNPSGFGFGFDVGAAWYFTPNIGIFAEAGFDRYNLESKVSISGGSDITVEMPFNRFLTVGISAKF